MNERQARLKKELNDESNNGKTIEESNSEASSSEEDCDDPNDPDVENSSEMKKQLASLEDNEFCGRDSGCTCILALYQVRIIQSYLCSCPTNRPTKLFDLFDRATSRTDRQD